ncbi:MAG TPA: hypothetical protein VGN72_05150 [Tepidisphaeraceae bacterium]|jgi:hypothetical protein|nr:hypothetical protein [Tepidisphaeraceae bacterium]
MNQFNPIIGGILISQQQATRQAADKVSQVKRAQVMAKNIAATSDRFEPQVESTEQLDRSHDDNQKKQRQNRKKRKDDKQPHIDVTG